MGDVAMFSPDVKLAAESAVRFFDSAIKQNKLSHSYLLTGNNVELKDKIAYDLTQILNCSNLNEEFKPCGVCSNCLWVKDNQHPETPIVLEPDYEKSKKGIILIKQVQDLLKKLQSKSSFYRVVIIKKTEMDSLPSESANSLLKTIEEPNPNILFLLYARNSDLVLPTISSRCQYINIPNSQHLTFSDSEEINAEYFDNNQIDFFDAGLLAKQIISSKKDLEEVNNFLDSLSESYLSMSANTNRLTSTMKKIALIEKSKARIKSFCSTQPVLEELFWSLSK